MPNLICTTCGTQFAETDQPPAECKICTDERQYVGWSGQQWTTLDGLRQSHRNVVRLEELGLYGIGMEPSFAIGQRALLVTHPNGNILWDCVPLIDDGLVEMVKGIGGISAIAISQPCARSRLLSSLMSSTGFMVLGGTKWSPPMRRRRFTDRLTGTFVR